MTRIHANNFITTLNGAISDAATSIVLTSVTGFPTIGGGVTANITLANGSDIEIVTATALTSFTLTVTRGAEGTVAKAFASGSTVSIRPTADSIDRKLDIAGSTSTTTLGTVTTGTWHATPIEMAYGGTNKNMTAANGGIAYSDADSLELLAPTATAGLPLLSGSNAAPTWGTLNGSGNLVATTSPTLVTPVLGAATATSINFGQTTLNYYEEGTFTPVLIGLTAAGVGSYSTQVGAYTRIGRLVTFSLSLVTGSHTGTGNARITGLPFTNGTNVVPCMILWSSITLPNPGSKLMAQVQASQSYIDLFTVDDAAATNLTIDVSHTLRLSGSYFV